MRQSSNFLISHSLIPSFLSSLECQEDPWTPTTDNERVTGWWNGNREVGAQAQYTCGCGNAFSSGEDVLTFNCSHPDNNRNSISASSTPIWIPVTSHPDNLTCIGLSLNQFASQSDGQSVTYNLFLYWFHSQWRVNVLNRWYTLHQSYILHKFPPHPFQTQPWPALPTTPTMTTAVIASWPWKIP